MLVMYDALASGGAPTNRVPRSRAHITHRTMAEQFRERWWPILFENIALGAVEVDQFETEFAAAVQQKYAVGVHSGTLGLFLALRAVGVGRGDEVITVGNSDISTTAAISHCGAVPVLCDILLSDFTINPELVEELITRSTKAILPVDLYGHPAHTQALRQIADRLGLKIVEDAALASGAEDFGLPVGAFADATVFSFAPFKPLGSVGHGATVTTNDEAIATRLRLLTGYGQGVHSPAAAPGHQTHVAEGYNMPLDPLEAALLRVKLPRLREWTAARRAVAAAYAQKLKGAKLHLPTFRSSTRPTFRSYTILVEDQALVYRRLIQSGIEVVLHYVPPIYRQPVYVNNALRGSERLPVTEWVTQHLICLPVSVELTGADIEYVIESVREIVQLRP